MTESRVCKDWRHETQTLQQRRRDHCKKNTSYGMEEKFQVKQANDYGAHNKYSQLLYGKKLFESFELKPNYHVAAFGCGTGDLAAFAASKVPNGRVLAFDTDKERIRVAEERHGSISNLSFHVGTINDVLKNEGEFDAIYSNSVLHWIPVAKRLETFNSIYFALKPGGLTFHHIVNNYKSKVKCLVNLLSEQGSMYPVTSKVFLFSTEDLKNYAAKSGFEILGMEDVLEEELFPSEDAYLQWFTASMQSLIKKDIHKNAMIKDIINQNEDGTVSQISGMTRFAFRKPKQN